VYGVTVITSAGKRHDKARRIAADITKLWICFSRRSAAPAW